jgi:hypothetical protein
MQRAPVFVDRVRTNVMSVGRYVQHDGWSGLRTVPRAYRLLRRPIVIGGCGRSGTSLLRGLIGAHTRIVRCNQESHALCPDAYTFPDLDIDGRRPRLDYLFAELDGTDIPSSAVRLVEKTPKNVRNYGGILRYFGDRVRIVNIVRDGRDVVLSHKSNDGREFHVTPTRWVGDLTAGLRYEGHPQILTVRYEDLGADPDRVMREIFEFVEEPWEPVVEQYLAHVPSDSERRSRGENKPRRPPDTSSVGRWRERPDAAPVRELLAMPEARALLDHFGYPLA